MLQLRDLVISHNKRELDFGNLDLHKGSISIIKADQKSDIDLLLLTISGIIPHKKGEILLNSSDFLISSRKKKVGFYSVNYPDPPYLTIKDYINYKGKFRGVDKNVISSRLSWFESFFEFNRYLKLERENLTPLVINLTRLFNSVIIRDSVIVMFEPLLYFSCDLYLPFKKIVESLKESGAMILIATYGLGDYSGLSDDLYILNSSNTLSKSV
ncbi:MAG: hypothetical protein CR982_05595 [Candidatus Cloacimonadota bacterium]|nr:MAG: hypothetical protein CR982_05595 [Candidatus Cloacimonadota bacterium]PIE81404.1 MAG: hypothetical protein CSA15_00775 [Candidatus Delongbacteria bacterium]